MEMVVTTGLLELQVVQSSSQIITTNICNTQFLQAGCPSCRPTNSVKALEGWPLILLSDNNGSGLKTRNFRPICRSWKRYKIGPYCEMFFQILSVPITLKLEWPWKVISSPRKVPEQLSRKRFAFKMIGSFLSQVYLKKAYCTNPSRSLSAIAVMHQSNR